MIFQVAAQRESGGQDPHSPRLTRSAKKNKSRLPPLGQSSDNNTRGGGLMLSFSPPDHQVNRRRESDQLALRKAIRDGRVQNAKDNGQLLRFSRNGRPLQSFDDEDEPMQEVIKDQSSLLERAEKAGVHLTEDERASLLASMGGQQEALQNLEGKMNQFMIMQTKSFDESNKSEKLASFAAKNDHLIETNAKLQEANANIEREKKELRNQVGEMKDRLLVGTTKLETEVATVKSEAQANLTEKEALTVKLEEAKEQYLIEKTRMESEIASLKRESHIRLEGLGESRKGLEDEKQKLFARVEELETLLLRSKDQYTDMKATQSTLTSDKKQLVEAKSRLEGEVEKLCGEKLSLQKQFAELEQEFSVLKTKVLPEAEAQREGMAKELESQKQVTERAEMKAQESKQMLEQMANELDILEQEKEEERINFQKLNEESSKAFAKLEKEFANKDAEIDDLNKEIDVIAADLEVEQQNRQAVEEELKQQGADANKVIEELEARADNIAADLEGEQELRQNTEEKLQQREAEITEGMEKMQAQADSVAAELEDEQNLRQSLEEDLMQKEAEMSESTAKFQAEAEGFATDLEHEESLRESVEDKLKKSKAEVRDAVEEFQAQVETLEDKLNLADAEMGMLEEKLEEAHKHTEALSSAKQEALSKNSDAAQTLENNEKEIGEMVQTIESLGYELHEKQIQLKEMDVKLNYTQTERDDAQHRVETFDDREEELFRKLRESDRIRRDLHAKVMQLSGNIRVFVRVRPELPGEKAKETKLLEAEQSSNLRKRKHGAIEDAPFKFPGMFDSDGNEEGEDLCKNLVEVTEPQKDRGGLKERKKKWRFGFDNVFPPSHGQEEIWQATEPLVQSAIDGYNVCVFAYGQTGSGKTYTMLGEQSNQGLISRAVSKLFESKEEIETLSKGKTSVSISVELLEIYNEKIRDLLSPKNTKDQNLKVTSNDVEGNVLATTSSSEEVMQILDIAQSRRCVKATNSNAESSRSHMVFTIHFDVTAEGGVSRKGKLHVCDLAGSERLNKSGANASVGGSLLKETKAINSSLSVLSNVIEKLQQGNSNVPFRESKLTMLLQNSLGGNSKTLAIVCCNPLSSHFHESLCSLRFADKVNKVELKASSNFSC